MGISSDSTVTLLTPCFYEGSSTIKKPDLRGFLLGVTAALTGLVAADSQDHRRKECYKVSGKKEDECLGFFFISLLVPVAKLFQIILLHIFVPGAIW